VRARAAASCSPSARSRTRTKVDELEFLLERPIEPVLAPKERVERCCGGTAAAS
jgi:hypothetical protein